MRRSLAAILASTAMAMAAIALVVGQPAAYAATNFSVNFYDQGHWIAGALSSINPGQSFCYSLPDPQANNKADTMRITGSVNVMVSSYINCSTASGARPSYYVGPWSGNLYDPNTATSYRVYK